MKNSEIDLRQAARNTTNRLINLQYKIDVLRKTNRNELIYFIRNLLNKENKN